MKDLTVIFLTVNEVPEKWAEYHRKILLEAIGDFPLITISRKPMDLGINILQTEPKSSSNVYWQLLKGAKIATTEYVAVAEDDTLYPKEHFLFRPKKDEFAYNMNHWHLFTWGRPTYSWKPRKGNYSMIAPRELLIEALEERFKKFPNNTIPPRLAGELGRNNLEKIMHVTIRKSVEFYTNISIINFNHDSGSDVLQRNHRKRLGNLQAYDIPHWGKAEDLVKYYR